MRPTIFSSIREFGLHGYLWGVGYRVVMRVAHRYNWHYAKPNSWLEPGKIYLWCQWCGFRGSIPDMRHPSNRLIKVGQPSSTNPGAMQTPTDPRSSQQSSSDAPEARRSNSVLFT